MARELVLTPRLQLLADWVPPGAAFADIGTDHGFLPAWLVIHGRVRTAIASDLRSGPLERARETGRVYGANDIAYRLANGLEIIRPEEVDTIAIAGMGGETIASILRAAPWTADGQHTLLLSPHTKAEVLRQFLAENGYAIKREALVADRGILYPVMEAAAGEMTLSVGELWGGAKLLHDNLAGQYLIEKIIRLQSVVAGLNRSGTQEDQMKADSVREILTELLAMREEWRDAHSSRN